MKHISGRVLTTHVGSLPRPKDLLDLMKAKLEGANYDHEAYASRVRSAVADTVRTQVECGIDIPSDGEQGKPGFFSYVSDRLAGFEPDPNASPAGSFKAEVDTFPEYYEQYFREAMFGGAIARVVPLVCTGPVVYRGEEALMRDINNLKVAVAASKAEQAFMPAIAPNGVGRNKHYKTDEEYFHAVAEAMHSEYKAIVDAGFWLQIDDPFLADIYSYSRLSATEKRKTGEMYAEAINRGLRGISPNKVRLHVCYGINEGPRIHDAPLQEFVDVMLKVDVCAYSFEAANPRHEHEYHIWEKVKLPEGKVLVPGVATHASNIVEHPELIAERIVRYAKLVGRENVIAGTDCGFSSQASYKTEVHPTVVWAKFRAMAEGARLASNQLWR